MEEKRSIKKMAFLLMIIANVVFLIAVITSVAGEFRRIEPGKVTTGQVENEEIGTTEENEEQPKDEGTTDKPSIEDKEDYEDEEQGTEEENENIMDKVKSIIGNFDVYKLLEIGLFAIGIFLFLLGIFLLKAVKKLN